MTPADKNEYDSDVHSVADASDEPADYTDSYDDKMIRDPVKRLFQNDYDDENDDYAARPATRTSGAALEGDGDYLTALSKNQLARGDRSRPIASSSASVRAPAPRPAIRARVPKVREPISARRAANPDLPEPPIEDDVNSFKARYSDRDALATAREPGGEGRILSRPRPLGSPPSSSDYQSINPIRWVALVGAVVVLVVMVVLVFQNSRMGRELDELRAAAENGTAAPADPSNNGPGTENPPSTSLGNGNADSTELAIRITTLENELDEARTAIETLKNWIEDRGYIFDHIFHPPPPEPSPPPGTPDPTPTPPPPPYDIHIVAAGDSLSVIARTYYGSGAEEFWRIIADENGITNPAGIQPGQELRIPRLP